MPSSNSRWVAAQPQQVVELLGVARQRPQRGLDLGERGRVDQLAQLLLAEQLPQQVAVERERLRTPLRGRRVVLVHVRGDVVEEQRRRERRRRRGLDVDEVELARAQPAEQPLQRRQVEHVLQALAVRLEHDREARVLARDLEQALRLEPLLPERRPLAGPAPRDEQRARGVLAEAGAEERRLPHLGEHEILELVRIEDEQVGRGRRVGVGQVEGDAVVRPDRLHLEAERLAEPRADGHRPRRVDARAERREDADAPVADLVAEPLDDDGAVGGNGTGRPLLLAQEGEQVPLGALVEVRHLRVARREQLARELADRLAELVRPADALALPERHRAGNARRRGDEHAVAGDLLDPPRRGAEHDHLAGARLVDHLLVELPHAAAALAGDEDAEEAAVGDRARVRDGEPPRAGPPAEDACGAIPDDPRPQLGELVRRVAAGEHVEDVLELRAREVGEGIGAADEPVQLGHLDLLVGADRDDVLREDVERVARDLRLLDQPRAHPLRDDRRLEQVGPELREDPPARDLAERVPGAADPLQAARHRLRRLDLDHEVDGAHVDPELERRGRDEARDAARLQVLLDLRPLLARQRAVVRSARSLPRRPRSAAARAARRGGGC